MGPIALLPSEGSRTKNYCRFIALKNQSSSAGFEPAIFSDGKHNNHQTTEGDMQGSMIVYSTWLQGDCVKINLHLCCLKTLCLLYWYKAVWTPNKTLSLVSFSYSSWQRRPNTITQIQHQTTQFSFILRHWVEDGMNLKTIFVNRNTPPPTRNHPY
jgi:hypothetical protein